MEYLGAWGTLIHEKKPEVEKISCQTPFNKRQLSLPGSSLVEASPHLEVPVEEKHALDLS